MLKGKNAMELTQETVMQAIENYINSCLFTVHNIKVVSITKYVRDIYRVEVYDKDEEPVKENINQQ